MEMIIRRLPTWVETDNDLELYHHGVKGQRLGVRRYQNEDGTLTPAGAKRLGKHQQRYSKYAEKIYGKYSKRMQKKADKFVTKLNTTDKNLEPNKYEKLKKKQEHFQNRADFGKQHMELYHHGIKGQRWGIRNYQNTDGSLTSAGKARYGVTGSGRAKVTTGKSKGVKRRGEGLGTGPVGGSDRAKQVEQAFKNFYNYSRTDGEYSSFLKKSKFQSLSNAESFGMKTDNSLRDGQVKLEKIQKTKDGPYTLNLVFKNDKQQQDWINADIINYIKAVDDAAANATSEDDENYVTALNEFASRMDQHLSIIGKSGSMQFDVNDPMFTEASPMGMYQGMGEMATLMPGLYVNDLVDASGNFRPMREDNPDSPYYQGPHQQTSYPAYNQGIAGISTSEHFKQAAKQSYESAKARLENNKKLTTKIKRFVDSWNEVRFEEISKIASLFKRK